MEKLPKETLENALETYTVCGDLTEPLTIAILSFLEELKAYRDAEEAGLLLKLPCKFGTTIYWLNPNFERNDFEIEEMKFSIEMLCFIDWFGKYAFLTYEEAEAALKALQEGE